MNKLSLKEIQQTELDIMVEFDKVARRYGLKYSLFAGTMLGAVRHKGFIPWDDDIDVSMPRPDYDRLLELNRNEQIWPEYLKLASFEDGTLDTPFMKIYDTRTFIKDEKHTLKDVQSLWIDVFPFDGMPETEEEKVKYYKKALFLSKLNIAAATKAGYGSSKLKVILKAVIVKPVTAIMGRKRISAIEKKMALKRPYGSTTDVGLTTWGCDGPYQGITVAEYEDLIDIDFEGHKFLCTSAWDKNLTGIFGDYMQLPPENERITHDLEAYRI
ncbi:MAG: LicD family protein [Lachnospiraceae bacterium]|nr:LicD family protein [Lachnospiraceae bacterium]MBR6349760.1 LicD family protein [Lachnospiraceae bacterium]